MFPQLQPRQSKTVPGIFPMALIMALMSWCGYVTHSCCVIVSLSSLSGENALPVVHVALWTLAKCLLSRLD